MNPFLLFIFILLNIFTANAEVENISNLNSDLSQINTSDGIAQKQLDLLYKRFVNSEKKLATGAHFIFSDGRNPQYPYRGENISLLFEKRIFDFINFESEAGIHQIQNTSTDESKAAFSGRALGLATLAQKYTVSLELNHDFMGGTLIQSGGISNQLTALNMKTNLSARWQDKWASRFVGQIANISDGNQKNQTDISTSYGISTGTPWIWIGFGIERLIYSKNSANYWSPSDFLSYGPRLEVAIQVTEKVSASGGLNINSLYDKDSNAKGSGYYFSGRVQYGGQNQLNFSFYIISINSSQNNNKWESTQTGLTAFIPF